jgi:hypothetical protein
MKLKEFLIQKESIHKPLLLASIHKFILQTVGKKQESRQRGEDICLDLGQKIKILAGNRWLTPVILFRRQR